MIDLFYTGASKFNEKQELPSLSLGGNISSSPIPDDYLNNVFSDIALKNLGEKTKELRCLALKNSGPDISNLKVYYSYPDNFPIKIEVGFVEPTTNACGDMFFEKPLDNLSPKFVKLYEANVKFESCTLDITRIPVKNETVLIYDGVELISSIPFTINTQVTNYLDHIVAKFDNDDYSLVKIFSEDIKKFVLKMTKLDLNDEEGGIISIKILTSSIASPQTLSGLINNSIDIEEFKSGKYIGMFIRRSILESPDGPVIDTDVEDQSINFFLEY